MDSRQMMLTAVKGVHTAVWFAIEVALVIVIVDGITGRSTRRTAIAAAIVGSETVIYLGNGARCPMTSFAQSLGADNGSVTDIFLPRWLARGLPVIHSPLIGAALWLHLRRGRLLASGRDR